MKVHLLVNVLKGSGLQVYEFCERLMMCWAAEMDLLVINELMGRFWRNDKLSL